MDDNKVAILLEDLISKFKTFGEGLDGLRSELKEFREETSTKLSDIQNQVTRLSVDNRQEHQQLMQMVK
jgi:hypothetical protein